MRWSAPRLFAVPGSGSSNPFLVGPDGPPDIRSRRPFFLLPILGARGTAARASVLRRIVTYIDAQTGPITDVIVLSHGWHRNFFSAMAAYDRIVARLANLIGRGAIQPPAAFNPLYIAVHWHSDPGENLWIDRDGRRSKREFLKNVREVFRPIDAAATENEMERDFELMFELLSSLSAPDIEATGPEVDDLARFLAETLDSRYDLRAAAGSELDRKVAVLWTCYTYAAPRKIVHPQSEAPGGFLGAFGGLRKLVGFLMSVVPLLTLVGLIVNLPVPRYSVRDVQFVLGPRRRRPSADPCASGHRTGRRGPMLARYRHGCHVDAGVGGPSGRTADDPRSRVGPPRGRRRARPDITHPAGGGGPVAERIRPQ